MRNFYSLAMAEAHQDNAKPLCEKYPRVFVGNLGTYRADMLYTMPYSDLYKAHNSGIIYDEHFFKALEVMK